MGEEMKKALQMNQRNGRKMWSMRREKRNERHKGMISRASARIPTSAYSKAY
jgi:hypothetical protein